MKKTSEDLKLAELALVDEAWETCQRRLRDEGLSALRSARRARNLRVLAGQISLLLMVIGAGLWSLGVPTWSGHRPRPEMPEQENAIASAREAAHYITEEQMLAMFPNGSCVLAEVNGQTELVFFDAERARKGFDVAGNPR